MCSLEELEALIEGKLDAEATDRVESHVAGCEACRDELLWLRTEAELMARRRAAQPELSPALWQSITERINPPVVAMPVRVRRWGLGARMAYGGLLAAAAAAVVMATWPHPMPHGAVQWPDAGGGVAKIVGEGRTGKVAPEVTLDRAEREYSDAAAVLEAEYKEERNRLPPSVAERYDRMLAETRTRVADARVTAGNDVDGRIVVLDGYAEYLRSLQTIVTDIR
jgi:putative zinc finger protein